MLSAAQYRQNLAPDSEHYLQSRCVRWFDFQYPGLSNLLFAIPNGGKRSKAVAGKLKAEGVRKGVADLFLSVPVMGVHGLYLEAKFKTGKQSPEQQQFQSDVERMGYQYSEFRSEEEFMQIIKTYLNT